MKIFEKEIKITAFNIAYAAIALVIFTVVFIFGFLPILDKWYGWLGLVGFILVMIGFTVPKVTQPVIKWINKKFYNK